MNQTNQPRESKITQGAAGNYASVNGLHMYYEIHGDTHSAGRVPLVLLHGGLSATGTSFGKVLPGLAAERPIIALELQAHGHTADIDRPFTMQNLASDVVELLRQINVSKADFFGYSLGAGVALQLVIEHPQLVRKLVLAAIAVNKEGFHPGLMDGIELLKPEMMVGTPFYEEYLQIAPRPEDFARMLDRAKEIDRSVPSWPAEAIRSIQAPTLLIFGDSDIVRPEHAVEIFRLLGGGVAGDNVGLPRCRLAILPGTTHITIVHRGEWLVSMINEFLDVQG